MKIRELTAGDFNRLENFLSQLTPEIFDTWNRFGFSLNDFDAKEIAIKQCNLPINQGKGFVALNKNGEIVAYSYLKFFPEKKTKKHIASLGIVVAPDYQGKKIGKKLMLYMHAWAKKNDIKKIWLTTYFRNKPALCLYKKLGYQVEGVFMYDELGKYGWDHIVSMALMLDKKFDNAQTERRHSVMEIEKRI